MISRSASVIWAAVPRAIRELRAVDEYPLDFGRGTHVCGNFLETLWGPSVGQEEDAPDIVDGTGRAVFVRGRSPGRFIRGLVQFVRQPLGERDQGFPAESGR